MTWKVRALILLLMVFGVVGFLPCHRGFKIRCLGLPPRAGSQYIDLQPAVEKFPVLPTDSFEVGRSVMLSQPNLRSIDPFLLVRDELDSLVEHIQQATQSQNSALAMAASHFFNLVGTTTLCTHAANAHVTSCFQNHLLFDSDKESAFVRLW
jgi:hypothetical protein